MDIEKAEGIIKATRLVQRINEMLESESEDIFEQLIRERYFLFGLITGLGKDNVAGSLDDMEGLLDELRLEQK